MIENNAWFLRGKRRPGARVRLFCLPFAGAGASVYHGWFNAFPDTVDVIGVQPPGRESRLRDTPFEDPVALIEATTEALVPELDRPFCLFGYSMGGIIAFEVARALRARAAPQPDRLFVASRIAPQLPNTHPPLADLPQQEFLDSIRTYFRPPEAAWQHPELLELLLPTLRADFKICDTYAYRAAAPLDCPVHAYVGRDDRSAPVPLMAQWGDQTDAAFSLDVIPGGHFFIFSQLARLQRAIIGHLQTSVQQNI